MKKIYLYDGKQNKTWILQFHSSSIIQQESNILFLHESMKIQELSGFFETTMKCTISLKKEGSAKILPHNFVLYELKNGSDLEISFTPVPSTSNSTIPNLIHDMNNNNNKKEEKKVNFELFSEKIQLSSCEKGLQELIGKKQFLQAIQLVEKEATERSALKKLKKAELLLEILREQEAAAIIQELEKERESLSGLEPYYALELGGKCALARDEGEMALQLFGKLLDEVVANAQSPPYLAIQHRLRGEVGAALMLQGERHGVLQYLPVAMQVFGKILLEDESNVDALLAYGRLAAQSAPQENIGFSADVGVCTGI